MEIHMRQGAAQGRRRATRSPTELLARLREKHATDDKETIIDMWWQKIVDDEEYLLAVKEEYGTNLWSRLESDRRRALLQKRPRHETQAEDQAKVDALTEIIRQVVLLDHLLSDGKTRLRDATREQITKEGGWMARIAGKLKPGQVVGKVLSEKQLQELRKC